MPTKVKFIKTKGALDKNHGTNKWALKKGQSATSFTSPHSLHQVINLGNFDPQEYLSMYLGQFDTNHIIFSEMLKSFFKKLFLPNQKIIVKEK